MAKKIIENFTHQELQETADKFLKMLGIDTSSPSFKKDSLLNRINTNDKDFNYLQEKIDKLKLMQKNLLEENNRLIKEYNSIHFPEQDNPF